MEPPPIVVAHAGARSKAFTPGRKGTEGAARKKTVGCCEIAKMQIASGHSLGIVQRTRWGRT
eukprot:8330397-Pyramimonas_sp.AAC.1